MSGGNNLSDDASCTAFTQPTDRVNTPAWIDAALADNGGPTPTHALLPASGAIEAGLVAGCPATDQRGVARQGLCDIGAFEFTGGPAPVAPAKGSIGQHAGNP